MNAREAINFVKSPVGAFLGFCLLLLVAFILVKGFQPARSKLESLSLIPKAAAAVMPQTVQTVENKDYSQLNVPKATNDARTNAPPPAQPKKEVEPPPKPEIPPLSLFAETLVAEPKQISRNYAPYGRLIPCELIVTVDSSSIRTPIIGLVTEDIYHAGRLIIPTGTEVHGRAQTDRARERIASANSWTLVWQTGEEMTLTGMALDREANPDGEGWGITDGSAGLRGRLIKTDDLAEIKLFAASFLSGASGLLTDREFTIFGSQTSPTLQNAPLQGVQDVLGAYAKQIYDSIQRDGFYVRVPAGKQFYLYVTQTIDQTDAAVGQSRSNSAETETETNRATANPYAPAAFAYPKGPMP
jgi:hypothetical protein